MPNEECAPIMVVGAQSREIGQVGAICLSHGAAGGEVLLVASRRNGRWGFSRTLMTWASERWSAIIAARRTGLLAMGLTCSVITVSVRE